MNKANECTCPSGDGSLRWPCPAHPAVEQAGGDERAAFERAFTVQEGIYFDDKRGEYRSMNLRAIEATDAQDLNLRLQGWQARAALAPPSPKREQRLVECDACPTSGGCVEKCMKAPTQPSPAQTQPSPALTLRAAIDVANARFEVPVAKWGTNLVGEEEQPEVVARVDGTDEDWFIQPEDETELHNEGLLFAGCELGRMIDFDRIVGALRADRDSWAEQAEQRLADWDEMRKERDAALARVEQQERTIAGMNEAHAKLAGLYEAAQAQHSVPEGWKLVPLEAPVEMLRAGSIALGMEPLSDGSDGGYPITGQQSTIRQCYAAMLAAAPGNSVPQAWLDVQAERRRQVTAEGWTPEHDDEHSHGQMARAAACYALAGSSAPNDGTAALLVSLAWPWDEHWWKPSTARRDMVKAGALVLAEIERLDRAGISQSPQPGATTASS
ncbi:hypothetical protein ACM7PA_04875 [Pseudomonas aeruginosa]